jgi:hypothetical protein
MLGPAKKGRAQTLRAARVKFYRSMERCAGNYVIPDGAGTARLKPQTLYPVIPAQAGIQRLNTPRSGQLQFVDFAEMMF